MTPARDQIGPVVKSNGRAAAMEAHRRLQRSPKFERWHEAVDKLVAYQARDAEIGLKGKTVDRSS